MLKNYFKNVFYFVVLKQDHISSMKSLMRCSTVGSMLLWLLLLLHGSILG